MNYMHMHIKMIVYKRLHTTANCLICRWASDHITWFSSWVHTWVNRMSISATHQPFCYITLAKHGGLQESFICSVEQKHNTSVLALISNQGCGWPGGSPAMTKLYMIPSRAPSTHLVIMPPWCGILSLSALPCSSPWKSLDLLKDLGHCQARISLWIAYKMGPCLAEVPGGDQ